MPLVRTGSIKNLSIALEALSRINNEGSPNLYEGVSTSLEWEIEQLKAEQEKIDTARSAEPSSDDDIPF